VHGTYIREAEKAGVVPFELPPNKRQDTHTHTLLPTPRALLPAPQGSGLLQRVTAHPPAVCLLTCSRLGEPSAILPPLIVKRNR
jgi:hypothetical protein